MIFNLKNTHTYGRNTIENIKRENIQDILNDTLSFFNHKRLIMVNILQFFTTGNLLGIPRIIDPFYFGYIEA